MSSKELTLITSAPAGRPPAETGERLPIPFVAGKTPVKIGEWIYDISPKGVQNVLLLAEYSPQFRGVLVYNIFADEICVAKCPPWEDEDKFEPHPLCEEDVIRFRGWLETLYLQAGSNDAWSILVAVAKRNIVNPPKDHFQMIASSWDGTERLDTWLTDYCGAKYQPPEYLQLVGSKWMMGAVARIYNPGCKFDTALILEGPQYAGKSAVFRALSTFGGQEFFCDQRINFHDKDSLLKLQGKVIFEMAELASFKRAESEDVKEFVSRQVDEYRPPYGRKNVKRPRMFVIGGSVNPNGGYLKDPTGNRRYWPVLCGTKINLTALEADKEQLWAEAICRYLSGERIWLEDEEYVLAQHEQADRLEEDALSQRINAALPEISLGGIKGFSAIDVLNHFSLEFRDMTNYHLSRVKSCLTQLGYVESRRRQEDGSQPRLWYKID